MPRTAQTARSKAKAARAPEDVAPSSTIRAAEPPPLADPTALIPPDLDHLDLELEGGTVKLTNLHKPFWPERGITKGDLLRYYARISPVLLPHIQHRAMVMKRYPNGAAGDFFFMKRAPSGRPPFVGICSIEHASGSVIDFAIVDDLASLLWVVNLGCIDLNPWYARCDDKNRPDYLHFDLDPTPGATFAHIREAALVLRSALDELGMPSFVKTTGSRGLHIYVPIERGPTQKEVWTVAKAMANALAARRPDLLTAIYRVADRPAAHVLIDYNQNAWGRTLASIYSVRPKPLASVSTPVTWEEVEQGFEIEDHRIDTVPARVERLGDLWAPMLLPAPRVRLSDYT
jgi:bifunctional non-homologous end joining protein LigD